MDEQNNNQKIEKDDKLSQCEMERDEYLNGWKRAKADLANAKREWEEKIKNLAEFVRADVIESFLPVLDALDNSKDIEGWKEIKKLTEDILRRSGLEEIKAIGEEFNPEFHESVGLTDGPEHKVVEVVQKGYKVGDKVIRASRVKIGQVNNNL
jgi:molecular chaperone GrpE